jgi:hypothetical protein
LEIYLRTQPEYRMGYQKAQVTLSSGGKEAGIIVNCQVFLKESEMPWQMLMDWNYILAEAAKSPLVVKDVTLVPREPGSLHGVRQIALANEKFKRMSDRKLVTANSASGSQKAALQHEGLS